MFNSKDELRLYFSHLSKYQALPENKRERIRVRERIKIYPFPNEYHDELHRALNDALNL